MKASGVSSVVGVVVGAGGGGRTGVSTGGTAGIGAGTGSGIGAVVGGDTGFVVESAASTNSCGFGSTGSGGLTGRAGVVVWFIGSGISILL
jgi:hypothetical protein